jgi:hypothetical protein
MAACRVAVLPSPQIGQDEVESLIHLDNEIRRLARERDALAESLLSRKLRGQAVEPGAYEIAVRQRGRGGKREYCLQVR